jgi:hypothetical protein
MRLEKIPMATKPKTLNDAFYETLKDVYSPSVSP